MHVHTHTLKKAHKHIRIKGREESAGASEFTKFAGTLGKRNGKGESED